MIISPGVWAASTQLGQILPYRDCSSGAPWTAFLTLTAAAIATGAGLLSWQQKGYVISRPKRAMTYVAAFSGLSFALALFLQGAATLLLSPCQH
ncbi:hypothetical protein CYG48_18105 (plasmid) [Neorhizobium sp. SOG26]|uniref:hypothetical protein n=1 Tax=Neorhizobium sp. SOG26 TaxID=2060726 RepID=UPI000E57A445|nr:hypothetical protein [Neorhizobium sp. SOG26]AXV18459.1 hypothetical protein CYG48_18105 [Neorhizobium sp. SOG26]